MHCCSALSVLDWLHCTTLGQCQGASCRERAYKNMRDLVTFHNSFVQTFPFTSLVVDGSLSPTTMQQALGLVHGSPPAARMAAAMPLPLPCVPLHRNWQTAHRLVEHERNCRQEVATSRATCRHCTKAAAKSSTAPVSSSGAASSGGDAIYNRPQLYEAAFSYRDIKQEVDFLRKAYRTHCPKQPLSAVLDLGCGPGPHAIGLAQASPATVVGMDLNSEMLQYARSKANSLSNMKGHISFIQGDLRDISSALQAAQATSPNGDGIQVPTQYDMVMCLLGTISHCLTNKDAAAAFRGAAAALRPGGLLVLELAHPGDLFDGTLIIGDGGGEMWEVPQGKDGKLLISWGSEFDEFDFTTQVVDRTVSINVFKGEEVIQTVEEVVPARQFTVQELQLLAEAAGLHVLQLYGDMSTSVDLHHEDAYRLVAVLQKQP